MEKQPGKQQASGRSQERNAKRVQAPAKSQVRHHSNTEPPSSILSSQLSFFCFVSLVNLTNQLCSVPHTLLALKFHFFMLCVYVWGYTCHCTCVEVKRQLVGSWEAVLSFYIQILDWNIGHLMWQQTPAEPFCYLSPYTPFQSNFSFYCVDSSYLNFLRLGTLSGYLTAFP